MKNIIAALVMIIAAFGLHGCGHTYGTKMDASTIQKGVTTRDQLIAQYGKPMTSTTASNGTSTAIWQYMRQEMKGETFIPVVGGFVGGTKAETQNLLVTFDAQGKVLDYSFSNGGAETTGMKSTNTTQ